MFRTSRGHKPADDAAPAGNEIDQPFARDKLQGFAQRSSGDPKRRAELALVDARPGLEMALDDHVPNPPDQFVV